MVDIENQIITAVATAVRTVNANTDVTSVFSHSPSKFPCVYITEADNYTQSIDSGNHENHANVMYEIQVYTNDKSGRKAKAKALFEAADDVMIGFGFVRTSKNEINMEDATVYRLVGRYTAVVSNNNEIYRR